MSRVDDIIADESTALEAAQISTPLPAHVRVGQPNAARSRMFSIRLRDEEYSALCAMADERDLPVRTLARAWLLDRLRAEADGAGSDSLAERVDRLARAVFDA